jgi:uncharacterized protein YxeA
MFWLIIIIIAIISVIFSFLSLRNINARSEVKNVKKELSKNRIVYQDTSSSKEE